MLKAVRFDEQEHKELLDFVTDFKDSRGKKNESEAIRHLMQLGLKALTTKEEVPSTPALDVEQLKSDLFKELMAALPFGSQRHPSDWEQPVKPEPHWQPENITSKPSEPSIRRVHEGITNKVEEVKPEPPPKPVPSGPRVESNPLLANLLSNRNK